MVADTLSNVFLLTTLMTPPKLGCLKGRCASVAGNRRGGGHLACAFASVGKEVCAWVVFALAQDACRVGVATLTVACDHTLAQTLRGTGVSALAITLA